MTSHLSVVMVVGVSYREFLFFVCYGGGTGGGAIDGAVKK